MFIKPMFLGLFLSSSLCVAMEEIPEENSGLDINPDPTTANVRKNAPRRQRSEIKMGGNKFTLTTSSLATTSSPKIKKSSTKKIKAPILSLTEKPKEISTKVELVDVITEGSKQLYNITNFTYGAQVDLTFDPVTDDSKQIRFIESKGSKGFWLRVYEPETASCRVIEHFESDLRKNEIIYGPNAAKISFKNDETKVEAKVKIKVETKKNKVEIKFPGAKIAQLNKKKTFLVLPKDNETMKIVDKKGNVLQTFDIESGWHSYMDEFKVYTDGSFLLMKRVGNDITSFYHGQPYTKPVNELLTTSSKSKK